MDCLFCKIINREIPADIVYEDGNTLAFLDVKPNTPGHTLVIPKDHFENIYGIPDEALARLSISVKKVALAIKNGLDADGINIQMNNEAPAGQIVFHAHIHVIPRYVDKRKVLKEEIIEKIKSQC
jgi:histidine triad (HIT) family protein